MIVADADECVSSPCANGGTCTDEVNGFTCTCVPGYDGLICGNGKSTCIAVQCYKGYEDGIFFKALTTYRLAAT